MIKQRELKDPKSCINRALGNEMVFVLLGRDASAPAAIRAWVLDRVQIGKNVMRDREIQEALACAATMEARRHEVRAALNRKRRAKG